MLARTATSAPGEPDVLTLLAQGTASAHIATALGMRERPLESLACDAGLA